MKSDGRVCYLCGGGGCSISYTFRTEGANIIIYCCNNCDKRSDIYEQLKAKLQKGGNEWK